MSNLKAVVSLYNNDPKRKGKVAIRGGVPTKDFLKRNRAYIKEGQATFYADPAKVFNPKTKAFVDRYTKTGLVKRKFKNKLVGSVIKDKSLAKTFSFSGDELKNQMLLYNVLQNNSNLRGNYRLVIMKDGKNVLDTNLNIPDKLSSWYNSQETGFRLDSEDMIWSDGNNVKFIFTKEKQLNPVYIKQVFANDKMNMCFFNPIIKYLQNRMEECQTKKTKQHYQTKLNKILGRRNKDGTYGKNGCGYIHKYPHGMPQDKIQEICDDMMFGVDVYQLKKDPFLSIRPSSGDARKVFKYINTRLNHVENMPTTYNNKNFWENAYVDDYDPFIVSRNELLKIFNELKINNKPFIYGKDIYGISIIKTESEIYSILNEYNEIVNEFNMENNMYNYRINATKYPRLSTFVIQGTHFNGTRDFQEIDNENTDWSDISHIDMESAYVNYNYSKYYNGFPLRITDFRPTDNFDLIGFYYIKNICDDNVNEKVKKFMHKLKWFENDNIYTQAELKCFTDLGYTFKVIYGAYSCYENGIDINMKTEKMLKKCVPIGDDVLIPAYCKFIGMCSRVCDTKSFFMNCSKDYASTLPDECNKIFYNDVSGETRIQMKKHTTYTMTHFASYITAYQRLIMLEQLLKFEYDDIYRVCVDGIYFKKGKQVEINYPFRVKEDKMTFRNYETQHYLSNLEVDKLELGLMLDFEIPHHTYKSLVLKKGAGGTGKTYQLGNDKGLIDVAYFAPSWLLSAEQDKYGWDCQVHHRLFDSNKIARGIYQHSNIIIDESSMLTEGQKQEILENNSFSRFIFLGDIDCQLPPVITDDDVKYLKKKFDGKVPQRYYNQMNESGFEEIIEMKKIYRFVKGDELHKVAEFIRNHIHFPVNVILNKIKHHFKTISLGDLKNIYKSTDSIIAPTHKKCEIYTELLKEHEKYKIKEAKIIDNKQYYNGQIVLNKIDGFTKSQIEKRHGFTIHSFQGCQINHDDKLFIDKNLNCSKMLYTAISRARSINQIYFIQGV